jgi:hypothetical protein
MNNENRAGDLVIKGGDGGVNSNGGACVIGPDIYKAGDAIQTVNYSEIVELLIINIQNSNLDTNKKESLIEKSKSRIRLMVDVATLSKLITDLLFL